MVLMVLCLIVAAAASYILPAGEYDRKDDQATGRKVVVAGTYHRVPQTPVNPFDMFVAIPKGMSDAASVIFLVFLVGGAFTVVDQTGALRHGVDWLVTKLQDKETLVIPIVCVAFATGGVLENMEEEIIAMIPVLVLLTRRLGFDLLVAVAISVGASMIGASFSPINPFQVGIAQKLAALPLLSGWQFRVAFLAVALVIWIAATMRYAKRTRIPQDKTEAVAHKPIETRQLIILILVIITFGVFVYGVLNLGWDFDQMSALFFVMGILAGFIGRLGITGTSEAFVEGFRSMAFAGLLIGFARAIFVVLNDGHIIDTIVYALFTPIANLPVALCAAGMMVIHTAIHFPVPSVSGHAVLTMPILVPLSDLLGLPRQVTVLAYQYGAGLCELITPTNGALMAILAASGVRYEKWIKFVVPVYLLVFLLGLIAVFVGIAIKLA
jgi:uncharacterized ion transporter superfamily protein YfcC